MNKYYLFACDSYYPSGGMNDCKFKSNDLVELVTYLESLYSDASWKKEYDYYQFHNVETNTTYGYNNKDQLITHILVHEHKLLNK